MTVTNRVAGLRVQKDSENRPCARRAVDLEKAAMVIEDVFHNRQAEPRAAHLAGAGRVDAIKTFGQPRQMLARDALAMISDRYRDERRRAGITTGTPPFGIGADRDLGSRAAVFDRVVDQILKHLREFVMVADNSRNVGRQREVDWHPALGGAQLKAFHDVLE